MDGLYLEQSVEDSDSERLAIFQSKYSEAPREVGKRPVQALAAAAAHFRTTGSIEAVMGGRTEPHLIELIKKFDLRRKVAEGRLDDGRLRIDLVLVTTGFAGAHALAEANAVNAAAGRPDYLAIEDIDRLGPIALAVDSRAPRPETVDAEVPSSEVLVVGPTNERVAVAPLLAKQVVTWPGIRDRSLFDLNVRRAMGRNRVQGELDDAIGRSSDHPNFLAYHNGLTVVCDAFEVAPPNTLRIERPSVVNGAQSVIAFERNRGALTDELRVFVKLVETRTRPNLAREVSRRSNTQNPVNPRMLMANSGPQLRLEQEFRADFPDIEYVTRPDAEARPTGRVINNDDAAQLLTALFLAKPWLAVKRLALFESENHAAIFQRAHGAAHVVLADEVGLAVDRVRDTGPTAIPELYLGSWRLTRIVMAYLAGQVLRAGQEQGDHQLLANPGSAFEDSTGTRSLSTAASEAINDSAELAGLGLRERFDSLGETDDYRTAFKNESELRRLGAQAANLYRLRARLPPRPGT